MRISDWSSDVCSSDLLGFVTNPLFATFDTLEGLISHFEKIELLRPSLEYDIDGVVYKVASIADQENLGNISRTPRWAIAHKFPAERGTTRRIGIDIQIGRTGAMTPVARSDERRVGKECVSTCRSRGSPDPTKKNTD